MFDEVIEKILSTVNEKEIFTETYPKFSGEGYKAHKIDVKNFHRIEKKLSGRKIAFIDGGNAEIIGSANFSLNLIRVCCAIYQNNKKIKSKKFEILAFTKAIDENGEIHFKTAFFSMNGSLNLEEVSFSSLDRTLMHGVNRAEIINAANAIRRFAELKLAKHVADNRLSDFIALDGNLQCTLTNENAYLDELYGSCEENDVVLGALGKTSSMFTDNGNLLSAVLSGMGSPGSWIYYPIADIENCNHRAEIFFVKFHDKSKHVFRLEIFNVQKNKAEEAISMLAANSTDPIFIGYPYGLVEADRMARVSNNERESLKTMLLVKLRSRNIERYLSAANAHEILDRISF